MKTRVTSSTEISELEVGQQAARANLHLLAKARMEFLTNGAVPARVDMPREEMGVQEMKRGQGAARILIVHQIQAGARKMREGRGGCAGQT